MKIVHSCFNYD